MLTCVVCSCKIHYSKGERLFILNNADNSKLPLEIKVSHGGVDLIFVIKYFINKKDKTDIDPSVQFVLLNSYLDYKGEEFKKELFAKYVEADSVIMQSVMRKYVSPMPVNIIHDIISMFNLLDIFHYIKNVYGIVAPNNLRDSFDEEIINSGRGTRVQTYIKDDYFELASVALLTKAVLGPIAYYGYVNSSKINPAHKEYILYSFIRGTDLDMNPGTDKIRGFIDKHIEVMLREDSVASITTIEKNISASEFNNYVTALVILQKISVANIVKDVVEENIITKMYTFIINKLKTKSDGNKISNKIALKDAVTMDEESMIESYRVRDTLTTGHIVELDWSVSSVETLISQMNVRLDRDILIDGLSYGKIVLDNGLTDEQKQILGMTFKNIIDPRGLEYLSYESMNNLIAVCFTTLIALGMNELAVIMVSVIRPGSDTSMIINTNVNKTRLSQENRDGLQKVYPYNKRINQDTTINLVEEIITNTAAVLVSKNWVVVNNKYTKLFNIKQIIPLDIKNILAEFYIKMESIVYNKEV